MQDKRAKISFWITVVSFTGSILFVTNMIFFGGYRSPECNQCIEKALYYQHQADSLKNVLREKPIQEPH